MSKLVWLLLLLIEYKLIENKLIEYKLSETKSDNQSFVLEKGGTSI